jgi:serine phosphatase RsbU (regulator of sigma subunit)
MIYPTKMIKQLRRTMSFPIFRPLLLWMMICCAAGSYSYTQDIRPLSSQVQERIERLEELVQRYTNQQDDKMVANYLYQISYIYWQNQRPDLAVESFIKAVPFYERINDLENLQNLYSNVGLIYLDLENIPQADRAFTSKLEVRRRMGDRQGIAVALVELAYTKNLIRDYRAANALLEEALEIALAINYETVLPTIYRQLANNYTSLGNTRLGNEYMRKYNEIRDFIARQTERGEFQRREDESQAMIRLQEDSARVRRIEMERDRMRFQIEQDSISAVVKAQEDSLTVARAIEEVQRQSIELLELDAKLSEEELERQKAVQQFQQLVIYSVLGGLGFVLILVILMIRSNVARKKANKKLAAQNKQIEEAKKDLEVAFEKIEEQNFRITQSISYAREIQRAMFPPIETLSNFLPDSFIFFRPVDMVSGDFYWFREAPVNNGRRELAAHVDHKDSVSETDLIATLQSTKNEWLPFKADKFIITAVDCTGHGVPGAFMSMIGYNLLDSITNSGTTHPDKILSKLHSGVRTALKQDETTNRDGMDISMCTINKQARTVEFAGANNPVIYITNGEMHMIKGDMMAIGGSAKKIDRKYQGHTIHIEHPTTFYILTDGYTDQFGGEEEKKYSMKSFKELLMEIHHLPMSEQKDILGANFDKWKENVHQIDDVLVIGFKLG